MSLLLLLNPVAPAGTTRYVATDGSDSNPGSLLSPYLTITKATNESSAGDTIHVIGDPDGIAVYNETVTFKSGVHYLGDATYRPVLDSNYTKEAGFSNNGGPSNCVIENFEVRRYYKYGILGYGVAPGTYQHNNVIKNCLIHHIIGRTSVTDEHSYGCYLAYGNWHVENCEIHHVNGWNESTGVWFGYCMNHVADGNLIYSIRKEGIRSYYGNLGRFVNNRVFLAWIGLEPNEDAQSLWANNYVSHCTGGINPKHTNDPAEILGYWGLTDDGALKYVRFWHNTIHRCSWAHLIHAINLNGDGISGYTHKADVRNNIFSGQGGAFFWDAPGARLAPNIVDYNIYSTASYGPGDGTSPIYMTGYDPNANQKTLAQLRADLGFELHGQQLDPQLIDPDVGDLDYLDTSPVIGAGVDLTSEGSEWGAQVGARGLPDARVRYTPHLLTRQDSSSAFGFSLVDENMFNGDQLMPLGTWVTLDLGSSKAVNHVFGDNLSHLDTHNPKRIQLELADSPSGPWSTVLDDEIYDAGGTSWKFEIPTDPVARYAKVTFVTSQGAATLSYFDMRLGVIEVDPEFLPSATLSELVDNFNDHSINPSKWALALNAEETTGRMRLTAVGTTVARLRSVGGGGSFLPFTLFGGAAAAYMVQVPFGTGDQAMMSIISQVDPHCTIDFWVDQNHLRAQYQDSTWSTNIVASVLYDPDVHKWWRVREVAGSVIFDVSVNGSVWTAFDSFVLSTTGWPAANYADVVVEFSNRNFDGLADRPEFVIDDFNLPPESAPRIDLPTPMLIQEHATVLTLQSSVTEMVIDGD